MEATSNSRIAKNTLFLYIRMALVMVVTLYTSRVVLDVLGASDYGIYNVVGGIVTIMSFLNGALGASTSRFLTFYLGKGDEKSLKNTFAATLNLHLCVAALVVLLGETIGLWFFYTQLNIPAERMNAAFWVYQFSIITTCISFTQVPYNASLIAHENMSIYAYVGLYEAFARLIIAYLITVSPIDSLIFYAGLLMLNSALVQIFYRLYTNRKYYECRFKLFWDKPLYKQLLSYGGWDMFGGVAVVCQGQGINILLNMFFGPVVNAARAIAMQIQAAVTMFVNNFLVAVRPQVIKSFAENNYERMYSLTFYAAKFSYMLMLCLIIPILFEIEFILSVWLGANVPEGTAIFAMLVLITYQMETFHSASLMSYHAIGKIKTGNIVGGSLMIFSLPLAYIFLKIGMPAYWVFIAIFIVNFIQMFYGWWLIHGYVAYSYRKLITSVYLPSIVVTIIGLILPTIIHSIMNEGWLRLIVLTAVTEISLVLLILYVGLNKKEREKIFTAIKSKISR